MDRKSTTNLGSVIEINPASISKHYPYDEIVYVDISSVDTGSFSGSTRMPLAEAPSRAKRLVKHGETILATVRPNLRSFLFIKNPPENMVVSTGFAVLHPSNKIDARFLYYTVTDQKFTDYLTANAKGSAYPAVDTETIARAEISFPTLEIQQKIAAILSAYDDLIENNLRRIKLLEEMAQSLYREWFVKFRFPGHQKVRMAESSLGKIPEGWEVKRLADVCSILMGQSPKSEYYNTEGKGLPFHQGVTDFGERYPSTRVFCTITARVAEPGDILFSVRAPVGRINLADCKIVIGRGLSAIRNLEGFQCFTYHQLREIFSKEDMIGGGTIFKAVTRGDMEGIECIYSPKDYLLRFEKVSVPIAEQLAVLDRKNINLRQTRDLLLPKLISGELDLSELDISIPEANA